MHKKEKCRLKELYVYEAAAHQMGYNLVAGVDEAGRGCLFGPVVAAACIIPKGIWIEGVDDSKKLSSEKRAQVLSRLIDAGVHYSIGIVSAKEIDEINIYQASIRAMQIALDKLTPFPDYVLVDGPINLDRFQCQKIIGGDALSYSIAAASIIAKETRDAMMREYHEQWPSYGFDAHKGYGTKKHLQAIAELGPTPMHRFSFEPMKSGLNNK